MHSAPRASLSSFVALALSVSAAEPAPCQKGKSTLYEGTCLGNEEEPVCKELKRFFELVTYSPEAPICHPDDIAEQVSSQVANAQRVAAHAPAELKNSAENQSLVKMTKLDMVKGFLSASLKDKEPGDSPLYFKVKPGKAAELKKLKDVALKDSAI